MNCSITIETLYVAMVCSFIVGAFVMDWLHERQHK